MIRPAVIVFGLVAIALVLALGVFIWFKLVDWIVRRREIRRITRMKPPSGFTMIELMIVIATLGIMSAIAIPLYQAWRCRVQPERAGCPRLANLEPQSISREWRPDVTIDGSTVLVKCR